MNFAAVAGRRSGRAMPSLRNAPQQQSMEPTGRRSTYRWRNAVQTNPATSDDPLIAGETLFRQTRPPHWLATRWPTQPTSTRSSMSFVMVSIITTATMQ